MPQRDAGGIPGRDGPEPRTIDRRRFLLGAGAFAGLLATAGPAGTAGASSKVPATAKKPVADLPPVVEAILPNGLKVPTARWLIAENARPGTIGWVVTGVQTPGAIEGYASQVSAVQGDEIVLFVNTSAPAFHMEAYRMGYYQGLGGRLVYTSDSVAGGQQPAPTFTPGVNLVQCQWAPSLAFTVGKDWPPGNYLLKLVGVGGQPQQYIPLTVRDDQSRAAYVIQNSVTTWQAYNLWGEYSLYYGRTPSGGSNFANRGRIVSFDRPYPQTWAQGSADFFGNEFPLLYQMESLGLDLTYWTDVDLHQQPELLLQHRALFSLGHDEYWSTPMRDGAAAAVNKGVNFAFLGANACYRQIRLQPSGVGPDRQQICYKDAAEDPISGQQPELTTVNWIQAPLNQPESMLIGSMYQSVGADADLVVVDSSNWLFAGTGLSDGDTLPQVVQGEYDRYVPPLPGPRNLDVLAHSPVPGQGNWSDVTYYTAAAGGGVLASGAASFVNKLSNTVAFPWNIVPKAIPGVTDILLRVMENVFATFGNGPAAATQRSGGNWTSVYQGQAATASTAQGSNAA
ncbi:MAG TPA: N,N-dimethylformamidase beta subunit family domain-containing protein [Acidimicrobiales bacterium]|nr:N,N-dimethylformamidase beta subunit family domain-containing protein [Acidimicrobiales bacterium]